MGISGPSSLTPTAPLSGPRPATDVAAPDEAPEVGGVTADGWKAGAGAGAPRQVDAGLTPRAPTAQELAATRPDPGRKASQAAVDRFSARVEQTLNHDAMSVARGRTPVREGDPLTAEQQRQLTDASVDLVKQMPLGTLSPQLATGLQAALDAHHLQLKGDLASTRLGDLGQAGGDIAKDLVQNLRQDSPTAFYSLAAGAAAAIGYEAYAGGTPKLARLGIKPEAGTSLFGNHLELKVGAEWGAHFSQLAATGTLKANVAVGGGTLSGSVTGGTRTGLEGARVQYDRSTEAFNLSGHVTANARGLETAGGSASYRPNEDFSLSVAAERNFQTGRTTAQAEAAWKVDRNVDFALSASHDSAGDSRVGVGVRVGF
jgi:hypothetical protein